MDRLEGSAASKFVQVIRKYGANTDTQIRYATVSSAVPLRIKVDGIAVELEADDCVVAERLTDYTVDAEIDGGLPVNIVIKSALKAGERVIVAEIDSGQTFVIFDRIGGTS